MDYVAAFNYIEAVWWISLGIFVLRYRRRVVPPRNGLRRTACLALVAFGVSDLIEAQTGAWWEPPSLLIFKGVCLAGIIACAVAYLRGRKAGAA